MKINFIKDKISKNSKNTIKLLIVSEENIAKSKNKLVKNAKDNFNFTAKFGQMNFIPNEENITAIAGAGSDKKITDLSLQKLGAKIFSFANSNKFSVLDINNDCNFTEIQIMNIVFGIKLQSYRFNQYFSSKKTDKELKVEVVNVIVDNVVSAKSSFKSFETIANNVFFVRDLVSEPANKLHPESYAEICKELEQEGLEVEILDEKQMAKLGMNALLGVGQGSDKKSQLIVLKWNGGKKGSAPLAFVGKGVTFDTGGISLKPANNMEDMKTDMAGSAVVVGLLRLLAQRKAKVNAIGVVGLVENMPSGNAQRPGDVVKSMSGQTIEIINTDAEGRLVLADALYYTKTKFNPELIVDLATLTGAIVVSLSDIYGGMFSNDDNLSKQLISAGLKTEENLWRMPLGDAYDEMINSDIADMKNVGSGRGAGSITAAQFLKRFIVDKENETKNEIKWAHLDIAGVAWKGKGDSFAIKGATGFGLRLLNQFIVDNYE